MHQHMTKKVPAIELRGTASQHRMQSEIGLGIQIQIPFIQIGVK